MGRSLTLADIARFGVGTPDENGRFPRYEYPQWWRDAQGLNQAQPQKTPKGVVMIPARDLWRTVFSRWDELVAPDLVELYHMDDLDPAFWALPWRPVMARIRGLLARPNSRLAQALNPPRP